MLLPTIHWIIQGSWQCKTGQSEMQQNAQQPNTTLQLQSASRIRQAQVHAATA
jgi:hypothetical protein